MGTFKRGKRKGGIGELGLTEQLYIQLLSFATKGEIKQEKGLPVFEVKAAKIRIGLYESFEGRERYEGIPEYGSGWRILRLSHAEVKSGASWGIISDAIKKREE